MTDPAHTFGPITTDRQPVPLKFIYDPATETVRYYDRRYAGQPGFTEHGQGCGGPLPADSFDPNATEGIRGWHDVTEWDLDTHTVRLVGVWLMISGFIPHTDLRRN